MNALRTFFQSGILEAPWAERFGWVLLHSLWQIAVIAGVYVLAGALLRRRSAQARYLCGCAAMVAMLGAPVATWLLLPEGKVPGTGESGAVPMVVENNGGLRAVRPGEAGASPPVEVAADPGAGVPVSELVAPLAGAAGTAAASPASLVPASVLRRWLPWATAAWLLGVCLLSMRPILGWLHIRRLQRNGLSPLSDSLRRAAGKLARRLGVSRGVQFVQSALVEVPTVVGSLRPLVLLPASVVSGLSVAEIEMILAHELAHVRRHDYLVNLAQTVLEALLFFHPAMWWVSGQVRRERENCCDDIAVTVTGSREHYVRALARLEEERAAGSVTELAATGGSLLGRVRRLLGQPGAGFGYRSASAWLAGLAAVGVVSLALAAGDASKDETGPRESAPPASEHEVVIVVREFFKAIESGDYDRAIGLATPAKLKREGLVEVGKSLDLGRAEIAEALVGSAGAAVLTRWLPASDAAKAGQFGFLLVNDRARWLIRDAEFLPDAEAVKEWLADFRRLEPAARPAEAGRSPAERRSNREVLLAHARALAAGDFAVLSQTWEFQDDLNRRFARKLAAAFARAEEMTVELVSMRRLDEDSLFACFLMRNGPDGFAKKPSPHFMTFHRRGGRWRCAPPADLRTLVNARTMGAGQMGRRAIVRKMIDLRFGPRDGNDPIATMKARRDALARLARPPHNLTEFEKSAGLLTAAIEREEKSSDRSWQERWRMALDEPGKDALPRPNDFFLSFYLAADPDDLHARNLPFPGREKTFLAEPFPCLTGEAVLKATTGTAPGRDAPRIELVFTSRGAKLFEAVTRESVGKRLAVVIGGKVVSAPAIMTAIASGKAMIEGDFSQQEADAMAVKLNAYRKKAEEMLKAIEKEKDTGNKAADPDQAGKPAREATGQAMKEFAGVTSIVFHNDLGEDRFVEVTKPGEVRELIAAIKLTPKDPCLCEHMWSATFVKKGKKTKVAICDHCFDIRGDRPGKYFKMSPEFFRLFAKHTGWPEKVQGDETPGKPGGDVQVRLHSPRAQWDNGRWTLFFKTDLRSEVKRVLPHYGAPIDEFFLEIDAVEFEVEFRRKGQRTRAEFMVQDKPPYHGLEMFLSCLDRQEDLFYKLTASTADQRVDAARNIQNELSARMKRPGHTPSAHLKDLYCTRFVPVLLPWLKDRNSHGAEEMAGAVLDRIGSKVARIVVLR